MQSPIRRSVHTWISLVRSSTVHTICSDKTQSASAQTRQTQGKVLSTWLRWCCGIDVGGRTKTKNPCCFEMTVFI